MTTPDGAVLTSAPVADPFIGVRKPDRDAMESSGVLSESVGLLMLYAVEAGDRETFDRQFSLLQARMLSAQGLVYWKLSADLDLVANASASVDDLRIAHALLRAYRAWDDGRYLDQAIDLATNVRELTTTDGADARLPELAGLRRADPGRHRLALLPRPAGDEGARGGRPGLGRGLHALARANRKRADGRRALPGDLSLFRPTRTRDTRSTRFHLALIGYYLAASEPSDRGILDFLRTRLDEDDAIYAEYDARTAEPTQFFESTSVYAIARR